MKAGSKVNLLVAEHVMNLIPWEEKRGEYTHVTFQKHNEREPYRRTQNWEEAKKNYRIIKFEEIDPRIHIVHGLKNYSSDISDSWQVIGKFEDEGYQVCIELLAKKIYSVGIYYPPHADQVAYIKAETAPLAICFASLRLKGIDINENNKN